MCVLKYKLDTITRVTTWNHLKRKYRDKCRIGGKKTNSGLLRKLLGILLASSVHSVTSITTKPFAIKFLAILDTVRVGVITTRARKTTNCGCGRNCLDSFSRCGRNCLDRLFSVCSKRLVICFACDFLIQKRNNNHNSNSINTNS